MHIVKVVLIEPSSSVIAQNGRVMYSGVQGKISVYASTNIPRENVKLDSLLVPWYTRDKKIAVV